MTAPILGSGAATKADPGDKTRTKAKETAADIKKAAAAFEAILVRQMLASSSVAGKGNYADMGVEALSTAVTQGGGLGLGHAIERAISQEHPSPEALAAAALKKKSSSP